jgi:Holliday junction resolvasome RuvABC DNA-binding subunit
MSEFAGTTSLYLNVCLQKKKTNIEALQQIIQICSQSSNNEASQETVQNIVDMGFDEERVQQALRMTKNEAEAVSCAKKRFWSFY